MSNITHDEKIAWLHTWCDKWGVFLAREGEVGFFRECVGITDGRAYVEYPWTATVETPRDAYHKHSCLAVLGRGEEAENQLYEWIKAIDDANGRVELTENEAFQPGDIVNALIHSPQVHTVVFDGN